MPSGPCKSEHVAEIANRCLGRLMGNGPLRSDKELFMESMRGVTEFLVEGGRGEGEVGRGKENGNKNTGRRIGQKAGEESPKRTWSHPVSRNYDATGRVDWNRLNKTHPSYSKENTGASHSSSSQPMIAPSPRLNPPVTIPNHHLSPLNFEGEMSAKNFAEVRRQKVEAIERARRLEKDSRGNRTVKFQADSRGFGFDVDGGGSSKGSAASYGGPPSDSEDDEEEEIGSPAPSYTTNNTNNGSSHNENDNLYIRTNKTNATLFPAGHLEALLSKEQTACLRLIFGPREVASIGSVMSGLERQNERAGKLFSTVVVEDIKEKLIGVGSLGGDQGDKIDWGEFLSCVVRGKAEEIGEMREKVKMANVGESLDLSGGGGGWGK